MEHRGNGLIIDMETDAFDFLAFLPETSAGKKSFLRELSKRTVFLQNKCNCRYNSELEKYIMDPNCYPEIII